MSIGFENRKNKKTVDYSKVPLMVVSAPEVIFPSKPEANFLTSESVVGYQDFEKIVIPHPSRQISPEHEIARLMWKAAEKHPEGHVDQEGAYFTRTVSGEIVARCIVGALILELPDGEAIASSILRLNKNKHGIASIARLLPRRWREDGMSKLVKLSKVQKRNDQGIAWEAIAMWYSAEVGYHPQMKAAA